MGKILASRSGLAETENVRLWLTNRYKRLCYILRIKPKRALGGVVLHCWVAPRSSEEAVCEQLSLVLQAAWMWSLVCGDFSESQQGDVTGLWRWWHRLFACDSAWYWQVRGTKPNKDSVTDGVSHSCGRFWSLTGDFLLSASWVN